MRRVAWRPILLAICAVTALVQIASVLDATGFGSAAPWQGWWGANAGASSIPFYLQVTSVEPGGPASVAGLRRGDLIDIRANTLLERYFLIKVPLGGRPIALSVRDGSRQERLTIIAQRPRLSWDFWLYTFAALWLLLFATLLAVRGAEIWQTRLLSLWIVTFVLTGALLVFAVPQGWMYVLLDVTASITAPLSVGLLAAFASGFAQPLSIFRRVVRGLCYASLAIFTATSLAGVIGVATLRFDPVPLVEGNVGLIVVAFAVLMAVLCGILGIAASRGVERQRAVWTLVPLAAFYCFFIAELIASSASASYGDTVAIGLASVAVILAAPVALTYAALSRRLIDVGFFLNRATVFAIVSAIAIVVLILVEWAANAWLTNATHTTSAIVGLLVALGLGISLRYIHIYVERFVDRVFFRQRHEDESALRDFAHEASYITDRSTLLDRAAQVVKQHTSALSVAILVRDAPASYAFAIGVPALEVGENDLAIVALRAWNKPIDLHAFPESQLRGDLAFPMLSRGQLVGVLICGPKHDGEAYAPDESEAMLALAHAVGVTLDTLTNQSDGVAASIRETQERILLELQNLPQALASAIRDDSNGRDERRA
jgi:GAF domain-containing protein